MNRQFSALSAQLKIKHQNVALKERRLSKLYGHSFLELAPNYFMRLKCKKSFIWTLIFQRNAFFVLKFSSIYADAFVRKGRKDSIKNESRIKR